MNFIEQRVPVITIDGPSGTGKGTLCHLIAKQLGWHLLDSGSLYRVLAYQVRKKDVNLTDTPTIVKLAKELDVEFKSNENNETQIIVEGENIFLATRLEQCGQDASIIAAIPEVREALLERQRTFARLPGLVTDGRDMGTVVFPKATMKLYLDASPEERAKRRYFQLKESGIDVSLPQVLDELQKRDVRDASRAHAPLKPAEDAILVDTTGLKIVQVFDYVLDLIKTSSLDK